MNKLQIFSLALSGALLVYLVAFHSVPAAQDFLFRLDCQQTGWITDICVESAYYQERVK